MLCSKAGRIPLIACDGGKLTKDIIACAYVPSRPCALSRVEVLGEHEERGRRFEYLGFRLPSVTCNCVLPIIIFFLIQNLQDIKEKCSQVFHS